ncbi:uncharacterized protein BXIN_1741 [Babesia sp. Xinjiang]|uniref:uncharacterized protein n=1 Tax=Babesia sp. Xinjiang TaxID=462227 RepID=UPI000A24F824|nr:uncharacterized protein BXIN_1678 [Babesia sp. Xinjiang]XP_028871489.1 uncharacterized protein BXIN_1741 [Babesia sp. Xinjiang]ORM40917.1 hypothetical protein BXIN_1678 [Babesia sp. Xinjiang]ORM41033.1 hypothetical protein BXIN_1741 [Babesia sp. Xinjiang]
MAHNVTALVTALSESRRFGSFCSGTFRLLPNGKLLISQHDDCLFALPYPQEDDTEKLLLSEDFAKGRSPKSSVHELTNM